MGREDLRKRSWVVALNPDWVRLLAVFSLFGVCFFKIFIYFWLYWVLLHIGFLIAVVSLVAERGSRV